MLDEVLVRAVVQLGHSTVRWCERFWWAREPAWPRQQLVRSPRGGVGLVWFGDLQAGLEGQLELGALDHSVWEVK